MLFSEDLLARGDHVCAEIKKKKKHNELKCLHRKIYPYNFPTIERTKTEIFKISKEHLWHFKVNRY